MLKVPYDPRVPPIVKFPNLISIESYWHRSRMYNILCLIFDKCTRELEVGTLTFNFLTFVVAEITLKIAVITFSVVKITFEKWLQRM